MSPLLTGSVWAGLIRYHKNLRLCQFFEGRSVVNINYFVNIRLPTEKAQGYQICKMCEAFAQNGARVTLVHPYRSQSDPNMHQQTVFDYYGVSETFTVRRLSNIDILCLEKILPRRIFIPLFFVHQLIWGLFAVLKTRGARSDLYITRDIPVAFWLTRFGLPTVYEIHTVPKRVQRWFLQQIAPHPALQQTISLTSFIRQRLIELGFPEKKISVFPDAVDLSMFDGLPDRETCRRRLGLPQDRHIIGYIGRFQTLDMEKGVPELVEAMSQVPLQKGTKPLLLCVGGPMNLVPGYMDHARRLQIDASCLQFVDRVPNCDVPLWIKACDIVTIPWSWTEFSAYFTSPMKLFEYMAAGVPIVASDLPSMREVLEHKKNACLVEPGNPSALAEGINYVFKHQAFSERISQQASKDVKNFTWNSRAAGILRAAGENTNTHPPS